jgi:N-acetylmuramoyl-L-alanine amidase
MCLQSLFDLGTVKDRGVKQAGFVVLKSITMPSVLVEAAFISNKAENKLLRDTGWQKEFGRLLAEGIRRYVANIESSDGFSSTTR